MSRGSEIEIRFGAIVPWPRDSNTKNANMVKDKNSKREGKRKRECKAMAKRCPYD
jgi:hypothetical protein